jgi:hypothetical protein
VEPRGIISDDDPITSFMARFRSEPTDIDVGILTPYLTPYSAATPGFQRTESLCARRRLNTGRPFACLPEHTVYELENRRGRQAPGGSNPSPSAKPLSA